MGLKKNGTVPFMKTRIFYLNIIKKIRRKLHYNRINNMPRK